MYRDARARETVRGACLRPRGLQLYGEREPRDLVEAVVVGLGSGRTLWENRRPVCRSLDGLRSLSGRFCRECPRYLAGCQEQLFLILEVPGVACTQKVSCSYTNARKLAEFVEEQRGDVVGMRVLLRTRDRGHWGELVIARADAEGAGGA